jgi:GDPmannose 4,6-dehydratase
MVTVIGRTALVCGATGQTGALLSRELLNNGYAVVGTTREETTHNLWRLEKLKIRDDMQMITLPEFRPPGVLNLLEQVLPDEIYFLAGPSSVATSFREPASTLQQLVFPVINFLEVLRKSNSRTKFFNAASVEIFGNQVGSVLNEKSTLDPVSPYGVGKATNYLTTRNYREAFGVASSSGILTNHESPLRGPGFFAQSVISGLKSVKRGDQKTLNLGSLRGGRDWLWAPEVAKAIYLICSGPEDGDYLVASGDTRPLSDFVETACRFLHLDMEAIVTFDSEKIRPLDIQHNTYDPSGFMGAFDWRPGLTMEEIIERLLQEDILP